MTYWGTDFPPRAYLGPMHPPPHKIYIASSWKNKYMVQAAAHIFRAGGLDAYDFTSHYSGSWDQVDVAHSLWEWSTFREALTDSRCKEWFKSDFDAMKWADTCVLILPCNRSAHLELGWFIGQGKHTAILTDDGLAQPELMYKMVDYIATNMDELLSWLGVPNR